jgi:hypothetical protein
MLDNQLAPSYGYGRNSMGIVPEDAGLPGWVPKNYMEKGVFEMSIFIVLVGD